MAPDDGIQRVAKMINYNKMKVDELALLLEYRGLDAGGTKTKKMVRLKKQDAENAAAERGTSPSLCTGFGRRTNTPT